MPAPYSADLLWRVTWFVILRRGQYGSTWSSISIKLKQTQRRRKRLRTSFENVTSPFCNHLSITQSHYAWKMRFNYPGIKWKPALGTRQNWIFVIICSRRSHNCKKGHFTSQKERERLQNVKRWKMHVQNVQKYCFSLSNIQICGVCVANNSLIWKPQFLSVAQFPFDNCHSPFSPTTFFEIGVTWTKESFQLPQTGTFQCTGKYTEKMLSREDRVK